MPEHTVLPVNLPSSRFIGALSGAPSRLSNSWQAEEEARPPIRTGGLAPEDIKLGTVVAAGSFGTVFRGECVLLYAVFLHNVSSRHLQLLLFTISLAHMPLSDPPPSTLYLPRASHAAFATLRSTRLSPRGWPAGGRANP